LSTEDYSELAAPDNGSRTPLHYACEGGHVQIVKWVLELMQKTPAAIDRADYWGSTPLSMAVRKGHAGVVKLLIDTHAVDIDSADKFGRTLIWWATEQGHGRTLRLLTEQDQSHDLEFEIGNGEDQGRRICDICYLNILSQDYYSCESCHGGDFDICPECFKLGGFCLDDSHSLVPRRV
jgi:ankyrin repeat protein